MHWLLGIATGFERFLILIFSEGRCALLCFVKGVIGWMSLAAEALGGRNWEVGEMLLARAVTAIESLDLGSRRKMIGLTSYQYHTVLVVGYSSPMGWKKS
jgi:hypothetical protein